MSMSMFNNTSQLVIRGGNFTNVLEGSALNRGLDLLRQNVATGAFYDAAERGDPSKCYPQTRLAILNEIQKWVRHPEIRETFIIWLYGPAGSGKSAIAQTIAEIFAKERLLLASFFFSRTGIGRNDTARFIPSIAYQLSLSIPEVRAHIAAAVEYDPLIFSRTLLSQMQALIIQPLNAAAADLLQANPTQPRLVIVDGLDEARDETTHKEVLESLVKSIQQLHLPLIFLVASRPEYVIRQAFNKEPLRSLMHGLALDEGYKPNDDIRIFFFEKFNEIRESHPSGNILPGSWPTQADMRYLVQQASGQFIYASTVMKYVNSPRDNPKKQLKIMLGLSEPGKDTPFAQLDALYHHILTSIQDVPKVLEILAAIVFLQTGYAFYLSVDFIETLLGYDSGDVTAALTDMHALIHVPSPHGGDNDELYMYHASLHDFLRDESRSQRFFLDARVCNTDLARYLLRYITTASKNIYEDKRFSAILNGFISHYLEASHTQELVVALKNFSLKALLSNIPLETFYRTAWYRFFDRLRSECYEVNTYMIYRQLRNEFDTWICSRYQRYPEFIQNFISAAYAIPGEYSLTRYYVRDIFDILTHSLPASDAICLRKLDRALFSFQGGLATLYAIDSSDRDALGSFLADHSRSGMHFSDRIKLGKLAEGIAQIVCRRGEDYFPVVFKDYTNDDDLNASELEWHSTFIPRLGFFPALLGAASEDPKLAQLLWELAVQYTGGNVIAPERKTMADACLDYIKRCGIYIPEHVHSADCTICANYKPVFPTSSLEPEGESSAYAISMPDESDTSQYGQATNSVLHVPPQSTMETPSRPNIAVPSASSTNLTNPRAPRSLTRTRNRPANPSPCTAGIRPSSVDPLTSSRRSSSGNRSEISRAQTPNPSSRTGTTCISPNSSPSLENPLRSMPILPKPKWKYGASSRRNAALSSVELP